MEELDDVNTHREHQDEYDNDDKSADEDDESERENIISAMQSLAQLYDHHMNQTSSEEEQQNNLRKVLKDLKRHARMLRQLYPDEEQHHDAYKLFKDAHRGKATATSMGCDNDNTLVEYKHDKMWESDDDSGDDTDSEAEQGF